MPSFKDLETGAMSTPQMTVPSSKEVQKRLEKTELPPQVVSWLQAELAPYAGQPLRGEGVVTRLSFIINGHSDGRVSVLVWEQMPTLIEALIDDPAVREAATAHLADINRRLNS